MLLSSQLKIIVRMIFLDGNAHIRYVSVNTCALVMCVVKIRITVRGLYYDKNTAFFPTRFYLIYIDLLLFLNCRAEK